MAKKSALHFLQPVLLLSKWAGTFPAGFDGQKFLISPALKAISKIFISALILSNIYVAYFKFYNDVKIHKIASFATLAGDFFSTIANISVLYHLNYKTSSTVQLLNELLHFETKFSLKSTFNNQARFFKAYFFAVELGYVFLNIRSHFFMDHFQLTDSILAYAKEFSILSTELQFFFVAGLIHGFYKDINRELMKADVKEETLCDIRDYMHTLENLADRLNRDFGLCLLIFLVTLNAFLNCDLFWLVVSIFETISSFDKLQAFLFLGVFWTVFDLIRLLSYFWVATSTTREVS